MIRVGYVYITTNLVNKKRYIGKHESGKFDDRYLGSGVVLKKAISKYGRHNFKTEILKWCSSIEELNESERGFIKKFNAQSSCEFYNVSEGGDWGDVSRGMTPEQRKAWGDKIRQHHLGTHQSEETKKKISESRKGIVFSDATILKMRANNAGESNPMFGRTHSLDTLEKMSKNSATAKEVELIIGRETLLFPSLKKCSDYIFLNYGLGHGTVKTIASSQSPYQPKRTKFKPLEGIEIRYVKRD